VFQVNDHVQDYLSGRVGDIAEIVPGSNRVFIIWEDEMGGGDWIDVRWLEKVAVKNALLTRNHRRRANR
jgi:hypothetical protein